MHIKKCLLISSISFLTLSAFAEDQTINYKNQRGSTMTLTWHQQDAKHNTGTITGTFTSAVGNCKADLYKAMPLTGYYNDNTVAITVNFPQCKAVAAMTGNVATDKQQVTTLWILANDAKDPIHKDWNSNVVGTDSFQKITG